MVFFDKKASKWRPPKTNSHQLETSLSLVERDLFEEKLNKNVKNNLLKDERLAFNEWRKNNLFNKNSNFVMRLQDKGNRFVVADKETDLKKAQEPISRSSGKSIALLIKEEKKLKEVLT